MMKSLSVFLSLLSLLFLLNTTNLPCVSAGKNLYFSNLTYTIVDEDTNYGYAFQDYDSETTYCWLGCDLVVVPGKTVHIQFKLENNPDAYKNVPFGFSFDEAATTDPPIKIIDTTTVDIGRIETNCAKFVPTDRYTQNPDTPQFSWDVSKECTLSWTVPSNYNSTLYFRCALSYMMGGQFIRDPSTPFPQPPAPTSPATTKSPTQGPTETPSTSGSGTGFPTEKPSSPSISSSSSSSGVQSNSAHTTSNIIDIISIGIITLLLKL